jgi:hypothetical protein
MKNIFKFPGIIILTAVVGFGMTACPMEEIHEHDWGEWKQTTSPDCTTAGVQTRVCTIDPSHTETRNEPPALGHNWSEWTVTTPPTTTTEGLETRTCSRNAAHIETRPIPVLLVSAAAAEWARSVSAGNNASSFYALAKDAAGSVYAAGYQSGNSSYTYGTGISAQGTHIAENAVLVKYDSTGAALWAKTVSAGNTVSVFYAVAVDASGNVYAAGYQGGTSAGITYGTGVTAKGSSGSSVFDVVLVKYDSSGTAQWARTVSTAAANDRSQFKAVAVDASGSVYAAGYQSGTVTYTYGTGVTAQGTSTTRNVVLVKYNADGNAQWAKTVSAGNVNSEFKAVAVDTSGGVYAAGCQQGTVTYTYGAVSAQGTYTDNNVVLVKYDSGGTAQWVKTVSEGSNRSEFNAVAVDASGGVYAAGSQYHNGSYTYGTGVSAQGTARGDNTGNVVLVKYNSGGTAQWAKTVSEGSNSSMFNAVAIDASGGVYAAGYQSGTGSYTYGAEVSTQGTGSGSLRTNVLLVKYDSSGTAQWAKTVSEGSVSLFNAVAVDTSGGVYAAGYQQGAGSYTYGAGVSAQGTYTMETGNNAALVKYR